MNGNMYGATNPRGEFILNQSGSWELLFLVNKAFESNTQDRKFIYNITVPKKIGANIDIRRALSNNNTVNTYTANISNTVVHDDSGYRTATGTEVSATINLLPTVNQIGCLYIFQIELIIEAGFEACNVSISFNGTFFTKCGEQTEGCDRFPVYTNYKEYQYITAPTTIPIVYSWQQYGGDIDGEAEYDNSGCSVSLSSDGTIVAIGAPANAGNGSYPGHVRVYERQGTGVPNYTWVQIGGDIDGEAGYDYSGGSVSLSSDGTIVAIGAYGNDGNASSDTGHVRVYERQGTNLSNYTWVQIGGDIDGNVPNSESGSSVSLSSDGKTVAIGAPYSYSGGMDESGMVRVYVLQGSSVLDYAWVQIGGDINGEAEYDYSGCSVSLSSDGTIVAIGAYGNDGNASSDTGHVRVYERQGTNLSNYTWVQIGGDIDGEAEYDNSGYSVSLSSDGTMVAIGANYNIGNGNYASGHVRVYERQGTNLSNYTWVQIGGDIDGEAEYDYSGYSVSLSSDGTMVAIGAVFNDGNGTDSGHVRVYERQGTSISNYTWVQIGGDIDGEASGDESGQCISLSSDGTSVAIGAKYNYGVNGVYSGHVRVYKYAIL